MIRPSTFTLTPGEAMLIDWVITMHSFDTVLLERLEQPRFEELRKKIAPVIVENSTDPVFFTDADIQYLLITCPITHCWGEEDAGFGLKTKLLASQMPIKIKMASQPQEVKNDSIETSHDSTFSSQDTYPDYPETTG